MKQGFNEIGQDHSFPNISWLPLHRCVLLERFSEEDKTKYFLMFLEYGFCVLSYSFLYTYSTWTLNCSYRILIYHLGLSLSSLSSIVTHYIDSFVSCKHCLSVSQQLTRGSKSELTYVPFLCVFSHVSIDVVKSLIMILWTDARIQCQ
jgi:translation initiation factor 2 beta subunit (eIF-2beta)/eIF-5